MLHIDHRDYYGGNWASFSFGNLQSVIEPEDESPGSGSSETDLPLRNGSTSFTNIEQQWNAVPEVPPEDVRPEEKAAGEEEATAGAEPEPKSPPVPKKTWSKEEILKESRRFNFDLSPKVGRIIFIEMKYCGLLNCCSAAGPFFSRGDGRSADQFWDQPVRRVQERSQHLFVRQG